MLEFIVLGQIPGTNFQITFDWAVFLAGMFCISLELYILRHRLHPRQIILTPSGIILHGLIHQVQSLHNQNTEQEPVLAEIPREDTLPVQLHLFE